MNRQRRYCVKSEIYFNNENDIIFSINNVSVSVVFGDYGNFDFNNCSLMIDKDKNAIVITSRNLYNRKKGYRASTFENIIHISIINDDFDITEIEFFDEYISVKEWKEI